MAEKESLPINTILGGVAGVLVSRASAAHAVNGGGQDRAFKTVAETVHDWNLSSNMEAFIDRATIHTISLDDEFKIRIMISDAPYSDHHFMVLLDNKKYYQDDESSVAGIVHNEDLKISESYWRHTLLVAQHLQLNSKKKGLDKIIIVENTCVEVSNDNARLPRSIKAVHAQVIGFDSNSLLEVDESQLSPDNLEQERKLWKQISENFITELNQRSGLKFSDHLHNYPQGYHLDIPLGNNKSICETADKLNQVLRRHHFAYSGMVAKYTKDQINEKPQPSYVTLITFDDKRLTVTISPVLVSFAGGLDTVGLVTRRVPDAPTIHMNGIDVRRIETGQEIKDYLDSPK